MPISNQEGYLPQYAALRSDDEKRGWIDAALELTGDMPEGAFCAYMQLEVIGDDWASELERLDIDS